MKKSLIFSMFILMALSISIVFTSSYAAHDNPNYSNKQHCDDYVNYSTGQVPWILGNGQPAPDASVNDVVWWPANPTIHSIPSNYVTASTQPASYTISNTFTVPLGGGDLYLTFAADNQITVNVNGTDYAHHRNVDNFAFKSFDTPSDYPISLLPGSHTITAEIINEFGSITGAVIIAEFCPTPPTTDVEVTKNIANPDTYQTDGYIKYIVTVNNLGDQPAVLSIKDTFDTDQDGIESIAYEPTQGGMGNNGIWDLGNLDGGDSAELVMSVEFDGCESPNLYNKAELNYINIEDINNKNNYAKILPESPVCLISAPSNIDEEIFTKNFHLDEGVNGLTILKTPAQDIWLKQISCNVFKGEQGTWFSPAPNPTMAMTAEGLIDVTTGEKFNIELICDGQKRFDYEKTMPNGYPVYVPHGTEFKLNAGSGGVFSTNIWLQIDIDDSMLKVPKK
jgi:hypothetical protein